jgi:hypothetical protein
MAKGSSFEREICHRLSEWWTQDLKEPRTDVFWRTAGSGARATVRSKKGKATHGQHGDVCAIDPVGEPLTKLLTFELKRGYSGCSPFDLIDGTVVQQRRWREWIGKTMRSSEEAGTWSWAIIAKRDRREEFVVMTNIAIQHVHPSVNAVTPHAKLAFKIDARWVYLDVIPLENWLRHVKPARIKALVNGLAEQER